MDYSVEVFTNETEKSRQMRAVFVACKAAGVSIPPEVREYFGRDDPLLCGGPTVVLDLKDPTSGLIEWGMDEAFGLIVELAKLPEEALYLRFVVDL